MRKSLKRANILRKAVCLCDYAGNLWAETDCTSNVKQTQVRESGLLQRFV